MKNKISKVLSGMVFSSLLLLSLASAAVPTELIYEGRMLSKNGELLTDSYVLRFSFWKSSDYVASDMSGSSINTSASNYAGWQEVLPITFNELGHFSVILGRSNSLSGLNFDTYKYLQVEIKKSSDPDSSYKLMDIDGDNGVNTTDRKLLASVPYARHAEDASSSSSSTFVIDATDSIANGGTGQVNLQFGGALNKMLSYDVGAKRFIFNDNVEVQGDIIVSGKVDGVDVSELKLQVDANTTAIAGQNTSLTAINAALADHAAALAENDSEHAILADQISDLGNKVQENAHDILDLTTQVQQNTALLTTHSTQLSDLAAKVVDNIADIVDLTAKVAANTADITALEAENNQQDLDIAVLEAQVANHALELAGHATTLATHTNQIAGLVTDIANLKPQVAQNTADIVTIKNDIANLKPQVDQNTSNIQTLKADMSRIDTLVGDGEYSSTNIISFGDSLTDAVSKIDAFLGTPKAQVYHVPLAEVVSMPDGSNNNVNVYHASESGVNPHQFLKAISSKSTLQDMGLQYKIQLPKDLSALKTFKMFYKGEGNASETSFDITLKDASGNIAFAETSLSNLNWTQLSKTFTGSFQPGGGDFIYITIKAKSMNKKAILMGDILFEYDIKR